MEIRRTVIGLVTLVMAAALLAAGQATADPTMYHDMYHDGGVLIVADSATSTTPDMYHD
jgi:hypothetical protein